MKQTEKQLAAKRKYDAEKMIYKTMKLNRMLFEEFRDLCQKNGDSMNGVLYDAVRKYVESHRTP